MDSHTVSLIVTFLFVFFAAISGGVIAELLHLPLFLGYVGMGLVGGSIGSRFIDASALGSIADIGVTLLLFTLGLEFSFHQLEKIIKTIVWAVIAQICLVTAIIFCLLTLFGMGFLPALFIGIAGALSSTAIVVKILSERGELDTVPGEVLTGWLILQDLAVIPIMMFLPAITKTYLSGSVDIMNVVSTVGLSFLKSGAAIAVILFLGKVGVPKVLGKVATLKSKEILLISSVGFVFISALITSLFGLSFALGAFLAGFLIAETAERHAVFSEVRPIRDVCVIVFFVSLGLSIPLISFISVWPMLLGLTVSIVLVKGIVSLILCRFLGYHRKTAWLVAVGLTQMSEFGFIIAREGQRLGALGDKDYLILITLVITTMFVSVPLISQGHGFYYRILHMWGGRLKWMLGKATREEPSYELPMEDHVVICGYGRVGKYIGRALEMTGVPFLVIDYNHETIEKLKKKGIPVVYGDPADMHVLDVGQVDKARALVIAIPDRHTQELIIGNAQTLNRAIHIICRTHHEEDQIALKTMGAQLVVQPEFEAALTIINKLLSQHYGIDAEELAGKISRLKIEHGVG